MIARRLLATVPVLVVVALLVFLMLRLAAGDPAAILAGDSATAADIARIRATLGLDRPLAAQFAAWLGRLAHGDLGESFFYRQPVVRLVADRLEPTLMLTLCTIALSTLIAVPLGTLAAWRHGGLVDRGVMALSVLGFSVPVFAIGYLLIWFLSVRAGWFPVQGYQRLADGVGGTLHSLVLPTLALSFVYVALIARMTRASVLDVLHEDFVRTARAKGLRESRVLLAHALRNAAIPIVTVIGNGIALLVGGVVVTESVFNLPGLGRLMVDAVQARDYPTVQAVVLLFSVTYVLVNLLIDLSYTLFDPRVRA